MTPRYHYLGKPTSRVDGPAKVTGEAKYAAEYNVPNLTLRRDRLQRRGARDHQEHQRRRGRGHPRRREGVHARERPEDRLPRPQPPRPDSHPAAGSPFRPLYKAELEYSFQPVALVVADSFEAARYAASLVKVEYDVAPHETDLRANLAKAHPPT